MSATSENPAPSDILPPPSQPPPSTPDELAAMEILFKNTKATDNSSTSVAPWLLAEFTTHKNRLIKGQYNTNLIILKNFAYIQTITMQLPRTSISTQLTLTNLSTPLKMMALFQISSVIWKAHKPTHQALLNFKNFGTPTPKTSKTLAFKLSSHTRTTGLPP